MSEIKVYIQTRTQKTVGRGLTINEKHMIEKGLVTAGDHPMIGHITAVCFTKTTSGQIRAAITFAAETEAAAYWPIAHQVPAGTSKKGKDYTAFWAIDGDVVEGFNTPIRPYRMAGTGKTANQGVTTFLQKLIDVAWKTACTKAAPAPAPKTETPAPAKKEAKPRTRTSKKGKELSAGV